MGNRTATALLASYLYAATLEWLQVPFSPALWLLPDLCVLWIIVRPNMGLADEMITALFLPSWFAYSAEPVMRYEIGMGVVILQFLLCFPMLKRQRGDGCVSHGPLRRTAHEGS